MIDHMATIIADFPGKANRVRCLAHIVNLVVKIILRQFDVSVTKEKEKPAADDNGEELDIPEDDEEELVRVLDKEEKEMDEGNGTDDDEDDETLVRDVQMIEDAMEDMIKEVSKAAKPVRQVLYKVSLLKRRFVTLVSLTPWIPRVFASFFFFASFYSVLFCSRSDVNVQLRKLAYAIKNSTTIILPRWNEIIEECAAASTTKKKLVVRKMPRDVTTRWNSTYDMLKFASAYREPINKITGDRSMKLRQYEIKDEEWTIVEQLRDCLKVRTFFL
jgi:hypothetical protein